MNQITRTIILSILAIGITFLVIRLISKDKPVVQDQIKSEQLKGVRTIKAIPDTNYATLSFSGKLQAVNRIEVYAEVSGLLLNSDFIEGQSFTAGQPLISIDSDELRSSLKAQKSTLLTQVASVVGDISIDFPSEMKKWEDFMLNLGVERPLPTLPELNDPAFKRFLSGKTILATYYNVRAQEERLEKYTITAPYTGTVGQSMVKKGTLIRAGQKLGEFIGQSQFELVTEIDVQNLRFLSVGDPVELHSDDLGKNWQGTVVRINAKVDASTQMVQVFVATSGSDLKEGMFLRGSAQGLELPNSVKIDRKLVNDGRVFILKDSLVSERQVENLFASGSHALVSGLEEGDLILNENPKNLFTGMKVTLIGEE